MQLKQMRNFVTVAEQGSFSQAARVLYTAQSSLSQSVSNLERELGFPLLLRGHDGVTLTQFGQTVYQDIIEVLSLLDERAGRWQVLNERRRSLRGSLRLAAVSSVHPILEQLILPQLAQDWPYLHCSAQEARCAPMLPSLWEGRVDLSLYTCPDSLQADLYADAQRHELDITPLCPDVYLIAVAANGPLGALQRLSPSELHRLPLACYTGRDEVAAGFFAQGFDQSLALEFNSFEKMVAAALSGQAAAVLPAAATRTALSFSGREDSLHFLPAGNFSIPFTHYLLCRQADAQHPGFPQVKQAVWTAFAALGTRK